VAFADWFKDYIDPGEEPMEPVSDIYYPIIDKIDSVRIIDSTYRQEEHDVVGFLALSIYWLGFMKNILPEGSEGIVVVFENPCNPSFTYELIGPDVRYLGTGDLHDRKFNHMVHSQLLFDRSSFATRNQQYTGIPVNQEHCPMTINVYPGTKMEDDYITRGPVLFTTAIILIFIFTSAVFPVYDYCIERRNAQSKVNASLLEQMVKERTQTLDITNTRLQEANHQITQALDSCSTLPA